jgi:hypothetical protein
MMSTKALLAAAGAAVLWAGAASAQTLPTNTIATPPLLAFGDDIFNCVASNPATFGTPLRIDAFNDTGQIVATFNGNIGSNQTIVLPAPVTTDPRWCRFQSVTIKVIRGAVLVRQPGVGRNALPAS